MDIRRRRRGEFIASTTPIYTIQTAIADALDRLEERAPQQPSVEHWIWTGTRLVKASPEASERMRQIEIEERAELQRLHDLQAAYRRRRWQTYRRLVRRLVSPLHPLLEHWRG